MLEERLNEEMKQALKAGRQDRLGTLRMMRSQILLEKKKDASIQVLSDPQVTQVLGSYAKKLRDSAAEYEKLGRPEESAKIRAELAVVQEFLPQPLTADEAKALVAQVVADLGASSAKDFGRVMKEAQARATGRADGKTLSDLARAALDG
ncbi:MAG TPA: GatB/YqeY domain-containing protein [Candidatus Eisenbacteria bacterium]|nr:GatB/YqeY domain-containing protein [Candidatus Eisenbacteria bacterium]